MTKLFKKVHLWLSVPLGLIIVCLCFSGASMVFQKDIVRALNPHLYKVEGTRPLSTDSLMKIAAAALPDSVQATGITVSANPGQSYQVNLSKPWGGVLFINQYTGKVLGEKPDYAFFTVMYRLHTALLGQPTHGGEASVGERIIGVTTLLMAIILITGFIIWYPKTLRLLKSRLQISLHRGWKRFWYDLHVSAGVYALLFLLACALTGLTWSFDWYEKGFYSLFGGAVEDEQPVAKTDAATSASVKGKTDGVFSASTQEKDVDGMSSASVQEGSKVNKKVVDGISSASRQKQAVDGVSSASVQEHPAKKEKTVRNVDAKTGATHRKYEKRVAEKVETDATTAASKQEKTDATTSASKLKQNDTAAIGSMEATTSASKREDVDVTTSASEQKQEEKTDEETVDGKTSASPKHQKTLNEKKSSSHKSAKKAVDGVTSASPQHREATASTSSPKNVIPTSPSPVSKAGKGKTVDGVSSASTRPAAVEMPAELRFQQMLNVLQAKVPDYQNITLNTDASADVISRRWHTPSAADTYIFNPKNGKITEVQFYKDRPLNQRVEDWVHAVHTGSWGGWLTKLLTFIACLIGITLPLTGYYLWLKRLFRKRHKRVIR